MPAFAQTKPWWVSVIMTPRSARNTSLHSSRISSTSGGSLPSRRRGGAPRLRGWTEARRRSRPSALETTFCEITSTSPSSRSARRRDQLAERNPSLHLRQAGDRDDPQLGARPLRCRGPSRFARRGPSAPPARGSARRCRPGCRGRAPGRSALDLKGTPASRAAATWRAQLPSPKAGRIAPGGPAPARWCRSVTVGHDRDVALGHAGQQPVELTRVEQRAVAGEQDDAVGARDRRGRSRPGAASGDPRRRGRDDSAPAAGDDSAPAARR